MRIITNEKLIKRNAAIGKYATFASLGAMGLGIFLVVSNFNNQDSSMILFAYVALIASMLITNIANYYTRNFGGNPRPDQIIENAFKGSDNRYALYQYRLPASHVLVCHAGVFVLVTKSIGGVSEWDGKRWKQKGGSMLGSFFGQDVIGNPNSDVLADTQSVAKFLAKKIGDENLPPIQGIIVFYNANAQVEAKNAPIPAMHVKQLKEYVRKLPKGPTLSNEQLAKLDEALGA